MIAEVIIQSNVRNLNRIFDYKVPIELEKRKLIGSRVLIPFGNIKKLEEGFVIGLKKSSEFELKEIAKIEEEQILDAEKIELAKWMAKRYFCNISDCLKLMLPPGTTAKKIENRAKEKNLNFVTLNKDIDEIEADINSGKLKSDKQIRTLRFVIENREVLIPELEMFADTTRAVVNTLCKNGYLEIIERQVERDPFEGKNISKTQKLELNPEQKKAFNEISYSMDDCLFSEFLIFGVTGSRKDRSIFTVNRKSTK